MSRNCLIRAGAVAHWLTARHDGVAAPCTGRPATLVDPDPETAAGPTGSAEDGLGLLAAGLGRRSLEQPQPGPHAPLKEIPENPVEDRLDLPDDRT